MRVYHINIRNKPAAVALGATAVIVGGVLVVIGLALVAGLVVAGAALGAGALLRRSRMRQRDEDASSGPSRVYPGLDPTQEVFPPPTEPPHTLERGA
jgi:hypothetical protein